MNRRHFIKAVSLLTPIILSNPIVHKDTLFADLNSLKAISGIEKFDTLILQAQKERWCRLPIGEILVRVGLHFLKTPYVAETLEIQPEHPIVTFTGFDCVTFVEVSLNIARQIKSESYLFDDLVKNIRQTRYRGGVVDGYVSRLHYTSDWIANNVERGVFKNITEEIGGVKHQFGFGFMSKNYKQYPILAKDTTNLRQQIQAVEANLNSKTYWIIPLNKLKSAQSDIQDGDIITIAISTSGLDYGHLGLAFHGKLLHASSKKNEVMLDNSIYDYVRKDKKNIGVSVLRLC